MSDIAPLRASSARLRELVEGLTPEQLEGPSYCSDWTIADVLSHLGSGGEILRRRLDAVLDGDPEAGAEVAPAVWDDWNAKSPAQQATDVLVSDQAAVERLEALSAAERARVELRIGPMTADFDLVLLMRLAEHALHTWDLAVMFDPGATVPVDAAGPLLDVLPVITRFAGKPTGDVRDLRVRTSEPTRDLLIAIGTDGVTLGDAPDDGAPPDLELPAEALVRLVYGRLDPDHSPVLDTPASAPSPLDELRRAFPGF